ncbi:hypothetical protein [uncultured Brevundimonas sp.]|uniref:hypothetical protein n=1 Tax=uncultured Brevundimonas sp. TaxID=213418 RepID=UPI0025D0588F|nr:hypothetical protein [uncultured Brevundimonas sp.]
MSEFRDMAEAVAARQAADRVLCPVSDVASDRFELWIDGWRDLVLCDCGAPLAPGDPHRCEP